MTGGFATIAGSVLAAYISIGVSLVQNSTSHEETDEALMAILSAKQNLYSIHFNYCICMHDS
jgi:hypothetical protein